MRVQQSAQGLLASFGELKSQALRLSRKIQVLEARCNALTASLGTVKGSHDRGLEGVWSKLAEEKERLGRQLETLFAMEKKIEALIDRIPGDRHRMVLRYRYLDGLAFQEIRRQMEQDLGRSVSNTQIYRLHRQAMDTAEKLWEEAAGIPEP